MLVALLRITALLLIALLRLVAVTLLVALLLLISGVGIGVTRLLVTLRSLLTVRRVGLLVVRRGLSADGSL